MISAFDKTFKLGVFLSVIDWFTFNVVFVLFSLLIWPESSEEFAVDLLIANIAYLIALQIVTISLHHRQAQPAKVLSNTSRTSAIFIVLYTAILGMTGFSVPGVFYSIVVALIVFLATSIERLLLRTYIKHKRSVGRNRVNTIILGTGQMEQKIVDVMTNVWNGYNLLGYFIKTDADTMANRSTDEEITYLGEESELLPFIEEHHVDELYIGVMPDKLNEYKALMQLCEKHMIRTYYVPTISYGEFRSAKVMEFGDIYVMSQYSEPLKDMRNRIKKRVFDFVVSLLFLCTLFPIILIIVAIVSKMTMPGPLFFKQKRTGYDGKDFVCYKFRSMKVNKDSDKVQAVKDDPRVTKWGLLMRHTNIDELPQFINVLKGNMSIVGPRPHMLAHTDYYSQLISDYMIRHYVKPGITGWAQTHGERGETKTVDDMKRRVEKDIWYIEHWSFWLDIQIILKTVADAIHGDDKAY
ncbi:undecaprenyl-phosphate glucose phosphotransferase [uncultured Prevotella sp.]|uniref:undecaprenyl-phosphate glucose phosphotransferase n=1 Tax=uncultured Prevotella sp. TaxID=159272 RepID=UPI00260D1A4E|nr:undecaprenyl-phosphate glucose phosphotransferase [uncultured Prevotella sp.]